jgi:DNA-binding MarR family transcriptional regulator
MTAVKRTAALPLDSSLFFKLVRVVNLTARPFVETLGRAHQISLNEWRAMVVLASHPGCAAHEVAEFTGLDKMSVSRAIAALERHARIRKAADPLDARRTCLWLNAAGQALFKAIGNQATLREAQLFQGFSAGDRQQLGLSIDRLINALNGAPPAAAAAPKTAPARARSKTKQA